MHFCACIIHHFFKKSDQNSKNQRFKGVNSPFEKGIFVRLHKIFKILARRKYYFQIWE